MPVNEEVKRRTEYVKTLEPSLEVADALYQYGLYAYHTDNEKEYAVNECWKPALKVLDDVIMALANGTWLQLDEYCIEHDTSTPLVDKYYEILKVLSPHDFEAFIFYMEKNRKPSKRFYAPRMGTLGQAAKDFNDLENGTLKYFALSMPPRVGKSTLGMFFLAWVACKKPNSHSAMGGHSGVLAKSFYSELLNLILTDEYTFRELFVYMHPEYLQSKFPTRQSAEEYSITLGDADRFPTIVARGIDSSWTGVVDISGGDITTCGYLYVDDLVRDREMSLSPIRMENCYQSYLNIMVDRKNDGAREIQIGTLWGCSDPIERMRAAHEGEEGYRFRRIPALDDNDESNFQYLRNGFSTQFYHDMRERLDNAEWMAKFMQQPYIREGLLFPTDELHFFNGVLPDGDSRIVSACDVALGGGDSLSMPIGREYSNGDVYIFDWVFNNGAKEVTMPEVVGKIIGNEIREMRFEANQGGDLYCDYVDSELRRQGYKCSCTSKRAPNTMDKMSKIMAFSGDVKRKFYFLTPKKPTKEELEQDRQYGIKRYTRGAEYQKAMDEMQMFVTLGKNTHEDAVDSLTQLAMFVDGYGSIARIEVMRNPFRGLYG